MGLVGVTTVSLVGTEGEVEATGEEEATEEGEGDTITVDLLAMVPVTGGTECGAESVDTYYGDTLRELIIIVELQLSIE